MATIIHSSTTDLSRLIMSYDADRVYTSRRFIICSSTLAVSFLALFSGHLDGGNLAMIVSVALGAYSVNRAVQSYKQ